ncbi:MAG: sugar ABC transporter substrate-binding protein [Spirochaetales bacterium]|nr:sugar ABC transporter substrate-binding protein [Spirochaetales bacterium]
MKKRKVVFFVSVMFLVCVMVFAGGKKEQEVENTPAVEQALPYEGAVLHFAVMADQFSDYIKVMSKEFKEETGAEVRVDILGYVELKQKVAQDFATGSAQYDLVTMDIVWTGQFEKEGWSKDLTQWIARDKVEIDYDDIVPVLWVMGSWNGRQIGYPMSGYGNSLIYRKDLFEDAAEKAAFKAQYGYELAVPETMDQLGDIAEFFTRPDENMYGLVANGARGPAVAQDWMEYMRGFGGQVINSKGEVTVNSKESVAALEFFVRMFDEWAPPGAIGYWWDDRESAYRTGQAVMQSSWSIGRAGYEDESISLVVGKTGMAVTPRVEGHNPGLGVGGWGVAINADSSDKNAEIAWEFIKYITGKDAQKEWLRNGGAPIRYSTLKDAELNREMPWLENILAIFQEGDGDYRPRVPEYSGIQDILGLRINQAITHELGAKEALDLAAEEIKALF